MTIAMKRKSCVFCGSETFNNIIGLKNFPVFMGTVSEFESKEYIYEHLRFVKCSKCSALQLEELIPVEKLYQSNHNVEVVGALWQNHYDQFCDFIINNKRDKKVLEIGCPSAKLAKRCINKDSTISWKIAEPNPSEEKDLPPQIKYEKTWLNDLTNDKKYDNIVLSHVFEHLFEPSEDLKKIYKLLNKKGRLFLSIPNMRFLLDKQKLPPASLSFEHTYYVDDYSINFLLKKAGFRILKKVKYLNHSLFYCCEKISKTTEFIDLEELNLYNEEVCKKFKKTILHYQLLSDKINEYVKNTSLPVYVFGAFFNAQLFFSMGLPETSVDGILDNSKDKIGKILYGTNLKIYSPNILKNKKSVVICHMGSYTEEIKEDIIKNINSEVVFI